MAESLYYFNETAGNTAVAAVFPDPDDGYVFVRLDPANDRMYYGFEDADAERYLVNTDQTDPELQWHAYRRDYHDNYIEDAALGSQIVLAVADLGQVHVFTASPGDTTARVVVFDRDWSSPGVYTVNIGYDPTELTYYHNRRVDSVDFIQTTPDWWMDNYFPEDPEIYGESPTVSAFLGRAELSTTVQRYQQVSGVTVYPHITNPVTVTAVTDTKVDGFPGNYPTYTLQKLVFRTRPVTWVYRDEWMDEQEDFGWTTYYQTWWHRADPLADRLETHELRFGLNHGYNIGGPGYPAQIEFTASDLFDARGDTWLAYTSWWFVRHTATGWRFGCEGEQRKSPIYDNGYEVPYPFEPAQVLTVTPSTQVAVDTSETSPYHEIHLGPVVLDSEGRPHLFTFQQITPQYESSPEWDWTPADVDVNLAENQNSDPNDGQTVITSIPLDEALPEQLWNPDIDPASLTYSITKFTTAPITSPEDVTTTTPRFAALVTLTINDPVPGYSGTREFMALVTGDGAQGYFYTDYDDLEPDPDGPGGSEKGKLIFDTEGSGAVTLETELSSEQLLTASFYTYSHDPDDRITILAQQNPTQDIAVEGDTEADGDVLVLSDYEDEDVLPLQEPQLVFTAAVSILEDYQNEVLSVVFDSGEHDGSVSPEFNIVFGDVTVLASMDLSADALVGAEGYSEGTPPTPGTCTAGTYTVTLPAGANPAIPLTYIVDGRLVTVMHNGVVVGGFYLPSPDLDDFCVTVLLSTGDPATDLPDPDVVVTTPTYMVDTSMRSTDVFMVSEGDHEGVVYYGPSVFITADNEVEVVWDFASPDDIEGKRVVWLFGYENPPIDFNDAALIAASGNGKYLIPVLP